MSDSTVIEIIISIGTIAIIRVWVLDAWRQRPVVVWDPYALRWRAQRGMERRHGR